MKPAVALLLLLTLLATGAHAATSGSRGTEQRIRVTVTSKGFEPASIPVSVGQPVVLVVTRTTDRTCAREFVILDWKIRKALPLNRAVEIRFTPKKPGPVRFACAMDMIAGKLVVKS
jgi:plastocyanin domain-containing protein